MPSDNDTAARILLIADVGGNGASAPRPRRFVTSMAVLQMLSEEQIAEDRIHEYFEDLYKIVCVSERPPSLAEAASVVRTTYIVDWEQLVHLLEDYTLFGEDIVEVTSIRGEEAHMLRGALDGSIRVARA